MKKLIIIFYFFYCIPTISSAIEKPLSNLFFIDEIKINEIFRDLNDKEKYILASENSDSVNIPNADSISYINAQNDALYNMGIEDASNYYNSPVIYYGSYLTGCSSSFILGMIGGIAGENIGCVLSSGCIPGAVAPAFYLVFTNMFTIYVKDFMVTHKPDKESSDYINGFKKEAKRKKLRNSMIGTVVGMALGTATALLFFDTLP